MPTYANRRMNDLQWQITIRFTHTRRFTPSFFARRFPRTNAMRRASMAPIQASGFQLEFRIADMEKLARVGLGADRDTELRQPLTLGRFRRIVEVDLHERT